MTKLIIYLYIILYYIGVFRFFYFLNRKSQVVLTYHHVINDHIYDETLLHLGVSCSEYSFSKQLDIICSRFKVTTELGVPNSCIITFDDGYKNNLEVAAPYLNQKSAPGLFFIPAFYFDAAVNDHTLWVDKLLMWFSYAPEGKYHALQTDFVINAEPYSRNKIWEFWYTKISSNYGMLNALLDTLNNILSFDKIKELIDDQMYQSRFTVMDTDALNALKKMNHKLALHSYKHDILSLLDDGGLEQDFKQCALHAKQYNINYYAYPFGGGAEVSSKVIKKCEEYGYKAAFMNYKNENETKYSIGRISLANFSNKYRIEARLCGFEDFLKKIRSTFRWSNA
ncbi:MAG: polysaccharide deacetylase family protein [Legionella sp.]|nr:polysaccharide deacetylase family protein [Legionella sp.]